ncbi:MULTISPECIES: hypothetical protein [unclassified Rathayibacter]|jgi:hypothetical protein|uniref:hypothetical protein n=1 Tax=unclassified Rathayibacter TaxID=2609250 RepID=UPI0015E3D164|nr:MULTISPECIES: hypothetical protein [unclassified Rathayibacter]
MDDDGFDEFLARSGRSPIGGLASRTVIEDLVSATAESATPRRPWWRRPLLILPVIGVLAATTAGAVVFTVGFDADAIVPINYTTDSGRQVSCHYAVEAGIGGTSDPAAVKDFIAEHDWSGIGQRVYEEALAHPYIPRNSEEAAGLTQANLDKFSFGAALTTVIWAEVPDELVPEDMLSGAESDCEGELR